MRPSLTFWDGPYSVCGVYLYLNKSTCYLSFCLSLNSFCHETLRTWTSVSPETRCVISVKRPWILAIFESSLSPVHGFKSQFEAHSFNMGIAQRFSKDCYEEITRWAHRHLNLTSDWVTTLSCCCLHFFFFKHWSAIKSCLEI